MRTHDTHDEIGPMPASDAPTEELAAFEPPLAEAVAAVLSEAGVPTLLGAAPGGELVVLVPRDRRGEALAALAARMDDIQARMAIDAQIAGARPPDHEPPGAGSRALEGSDEDSERPLVLDRFRSLGWVAVALVPLLIISLAGVRLPAAVVVLLMVGSVVLVSAWRNGRFGGDG